MLGSSFFAQSTQVLKPGIDVNYELGNPESLTHRLQRRKWIFSEYWLEYLTVYWMTYFIFEHQSQAGVG